MEKKDEFAVVVMTDPKIRTTQHLFLLDLVTEKYRLLRTLENTTKREAQEHASVLASLSLEELAKELKKFSNKVIEEENKNNPQQQ
jgi:hypothetical protein